MKYARTEYDAKATLSSQVLCCKHYISIYLDEYWQTLGFLQKKTIWSQNYPNFLKRKIMACVCDVLIIHNTNHRLSKFWLSPLVIYLTVYSFFQEYSS